MLQPDSVFALSIKSKTILKYFPTDPHPLSNYQIARLIRVKPSESIFGFSVLNLILKIFLVWNISFLKANHKCFLIGKTTINKAIISDILIQILKAITLQINFKYYLKNYLALVWRYDLFHIVLVIPSNIPASFLKPLNLVLEVVF